MLFNSLPYISNGRLPLVINPYLISKQLFYIPVVCDVFLYYMLNKYMTSHLNTIKSTLFQHSSMQKTRDGVIGNKKESPAHFYNDMYGNSHNLSVT